MNDVSIRQAVLSDLDALAPLFDRYRQFQGQPADLAAARAFLRARFDHGESVVFIASAGGHPVGFAQLYPSFSSVTLRRVFLLNDVFVEATVRRNGVASRLLAALEAHAWSLDATRVTLFVARSNSTGQALYGSRGWTEDDAFFVYHRHRSDDVDRAAADRSRETLR
jgi:GNAT superfamily N-acetyltransferase